MAITYTLPNIGLRTKLDILNNEAQSGHLVSQLYLKPFTISDSIDNSYTQPTFPGYAQIQIPAGTVSGDTLSPVPTLSFASVTFSCTATVAPQTIQGVAYIASNPFTGAYHVLAIADLPGGPQVVSQPGDSIISQLTLTDQRAPGQP